MNKLLIASLLVLSLGLGCSDSCSTGVKTTPTADVQTVSPVTAGEGEGE